MDHARFDALVRALASRRRALGGGLALLLGFGGGTRVAARRCKRPGGKCGRRKKCCAGARCRGKRCRCKPSHPMWAGTCCKNRFALADAMGLEPLPGTEFCCAGKDVCRQDSDPAHDDCCQENETCLNGKCCCDGCRGTVICGGVCCGSDSCCNGKCCPNGQICAEIDGVHTCVSAAARECGSCYSGETCWDEICCTPDRMCTVTEGNDDNAPKCCAVNEYCDQVLGTCCSNGNICTTGKKVRIRV